MEAQCATFHGTSLARALQRVHRASTSQLESLPWLLMLIRFAGIHLADGPDCNREWANASRYYGDESKHAITVPVLQRDSTGLCAAQSVPKKFDHACAQASTCWCPIGMWQLPRQLACAMRALSLHRVRTAATIGTFTGWTDTLLYSYLRRLHQLRRAPGELLFRAVTIDVRDFRTPCVSALMKQEGISFIKHTRLEDGTQPLLAEFTGQSSQGMIDACFIDADHTYEGVSNDVKQAWPFCRMLLFHDTLQSTGVRKAWAELKQRANASTAGDSVYECHEQVRGIPHSIKKKTGPGMGIGIYTRGGTRVYD